MNYETAEEQIRTRLAAKLGSNVEARVLPEDEAEYGKIAVAKPRVTVSYKMSDFPTGERASKASSRTLGSFVSQEEQIVFEITMESRKLRGRNGLYDVLTKTKKALLGFTPSDCQKLQVLKFGFVERTESLFIYQLLISTTTTIVEEQDAQVLPTLEQIVVDGPLGESITPPEA